MFVPEAAGEPEAGVDPALPNSEGFGWAEDDEAAPPNKFVVPPVPGAAPEPPPKEKDGVPEAPPNRDPGAGAVVD